MTMRFVPLALGFALVFGPWAVLTARTPQAHIGLDADRNVRIEPEAGGDVVISGTAWSAILVKLELVDGLVAQVHRLEAQLGGLREAPASPELWWRPWMGPRV